MRSHPLYVLGISKLFKQTAREIYSEMGGPLTPATTAIRAIIIEVPTTTPMHCETLRPRANKDEPAVQDEVLHPIAGC
jgi:hypothetical protein